MKKSDIELLKMTGAVFMASVTANIVGNTIYTKSRIGVDKKRMIIGTGIGLGATFLLIKMIKK